MSSLQERSGVGWADSWPCLPYRLAAALADRDAKIAAVRSLAKYLEGLAPGDVHYAGRIRAALGEAGD